MEFINETATPTPSGSGAQDILSRVGAALYGAPDEVESKQSDNDEVPNDDENLPDGDDSDLKVEDDSDVDDSLASYLGIDESNLYQGDDGKIMVNVKVDGESKPVSFKDVIASYQLQGHVNNKSIALQNERKEFEQVRSGEISRLQGQLREATALNSVLEKQLVGEYDSIDWDRMRHEQPAEWAAARQDFADRASQLRRLKDSILDSDKQLQAEQQQKAFEQHQMHLSAEYEKMLQKNPSWSDPAAKQKDVDAIKSFLSSEYGFTSADVDSITDSRLVSLVQDAMLFKSGKKNLETLKAKSIPKFKTPTSNKQNLDNLAKARKAKSHNDAIRRTNGSISAIANKLLDRM